MTEEEPRSPADPQKSPDSSPPGAAPDPYGPLVRMFTCPDCHTDYSRLVQAIIIPGAGGMVAGFVKPARCPECRAWQIGPGRMVYRPMPGVQA